MEKEKFDTVLVKKYVYEKVEKSDVAINIPHEPIFFQEWNCRVVTGIFPNYSPNFKTNIPELHCLDVIQISDDICDIRIIKTSISVHQSNLSDIVSEFDFKGKSETDYLQDKVVRYLKEFYNSDRVTKEFFKCKLTEVNNEINKIANEYFMAKFEVLKNN